MTLVLLARTAMAEVVPAKQQGLLLLRILAYDHNLSNRIDKGTVTIVVVSKSGSSDSDEQAADVAAAIKEISKSAKIANNAISVVRLVFSEKTFESDLGRVKAAGLYVAPGLGENLSTITAATQSRKLLSFSGSSDYVAAGVSVGFGLDGGHPQILVNVPASRSEGADLDVALLKAAKIVKK